MQSKSLYCMPARLLFIKPSCRPAPCPPTHPRPRLCCSFGPETVVRRRRLPYIRSARNLYAYSTCVSSERDKRIIIALVMMMVAVALYHCVHALAIHLLCGSNSSRTVLQCTVYLYSKCC